MQKTEVWTNTQELTGADHQELPPGNAFASLIH